MRPPWWCFLSVARRMGDREGASRARGEMFFERDSFPLAHARDVGARVFARMCHFVDASFARVLLGSGRRRLISIGFLFLPSHRTGCCTRIRPQTSQTRRAMGRSESQGRRGEESAGEEARRGVQTRRKVREGVRGPGERFDSSFLKREARAKGGFYVEPEQKLIFVMRLRGLNDMHPKTRHILQLLRLRQFTTGVFRKVNKATVNAALKGWTVTSCGGYPNLKTVKELIYKRGHGKVNKQRISR